MMKRQVEQTFEGAITRILDNAMGLNGAEYGTLQLPRSDYLLIVRGETLLLQLLRTGLFYPLHEALAAST